MGQTRPFFCLRPLLNTMTNTVQNLTVNCRSIDGVLGIRTRDLGVLGADKSTKLWRPPPQNYMFCIALGKLVKTFLYNWPKGLEMAKKL